MKKQRRGARNLCCICKWKELCLGPFYCLLPVAFCLLPVACCLLPDSQKQTLLLQTRQKGKRGRFAIYLRLVARNLCLCFNLWFSCKKPLLLQARQKGTRAQGQQGPIGLRPEGLLQRKGKRGDERRGKQKIIIVNLNERKYWFYSRLISSLRVRSELTPPVGVIIFVLFLFLEPLLGG